MHNFRECAIVVGVVALFACTVKDDSDHQQKTTVEPVAPLFDGSKECIVLEWNPDIFECKYCDAIHEHETINGLILVRHKAEEIDARYASRAILNIGLLEHRLAYGDPLVTVVPPQSGSADCHDLGIVPGDNNQWFSMSILHIDGSSRSLTWPVNPYRELEPDLKQNLRIKNHANYLQNNL